MDGIEATDNFDATRLGEADFWFSPFTLPQYDLLVAQGYITQDEADRYRCEREDAGLAMDPRVLPMRPARSFEWLWEAGGPSVASDSCRIDIGGLEFIAYAWRHSEHGELNCHPSIPKPDDYLGWKLKKPMAATGVAWEAACKLREGVYARTSGTAPTLRARILAAQIVGDQAFEAGRLAGRRELKSEIFAL